MLKNIAIIVTAAILLCACRSSAVHWSTRWPSHNPDGTAFMHSVDFGGDAVYGLCLQAPGIVEWYRWQRSGSMSQAPSLEVGECLHIARARDGLWVFAADAGDNWRLTQIGKNSVSCSHIEGPRGWDLIALGASANGTQIAVLYQSSAPKWTREALIGRLSEDGHELSEVLKTRWESYEEPCIAISNDGAFIAVSTWKKGVLVVDVRQRQELWAKRPPGELLSRHVAFAPDNSVVYTAGMGGDVYALDVASGDVRREWSTGGKRGVSALAVSPDGAYVAAATIPDGQIWVWPADGTARCATFWDTNPISALGFSPDSKYLASVAKGTLKTWAVSAR